MSQFEYKEPVPSDIDIAQAATLKPIRDVAAQLGLTEDDLDLYGKYKAKVHLDVLKRLQDRPQGKYIDVTAITPTPLGEGKTTTTVGVSQEEDTPPSGKADGDGPSFIVRVIRVRIGERQRILENRGGLVEGHTVFSQVRRGFSRVPTVDQGARTLRSTGAGLGPNRSGQTSSSSCSSSRSCRSNRAPKASQIPSA